MNVTSGESPGPDAVPPEGKAPAPSQEIDITVPVSPPGKRDPRMVRRFSKLGRHLRMIGQYLATRFTGGSQREVFKDVDRFCLFLGYPRSGSSLMGSLLDAHPNAIIAHELHFLRYFKFGFNRDQMYLMLLRNSEKSASGGRTQSGYSYAVPNQWQGRFTQLRVIGDKRSSALVRILERHPNLLEDFGKEVRVPLKCIHMIRNPYDNITTICTTGSTGRLDEAVDYYFRLVRVLDAVRHRIAPESFLDLRHESVIADPTGSLRRACEYLGLPAEESYLRDCAGIVFTSPRKTRFNIPWAPVLIDRVKEGIEKYEFLRGYSYQD